MKPCLMLIKLMSLQRSSYSTLRDRMKNDKPIIIWILSEFRLRNYNLSDFKASDYNIYLMGSNRVLSLFKSTIAAVFNNVIEINELPYGDSQYFIPDFN